MLDALERRAANVPHALPRIPLISNITGTFFAAGTGPDASYWRRHAREPVRFAAAIATLRAAGITALVEVGPHPDLLALTGQAVPDAPWSATASLRRGQDDWRELLTGVASLYVLGAPVRWEELIAGQGGRHISLPTYPFQRERYWISAPDEPNARAIERVAADPFFQSQWAATNARGTNSTSLTRDLLRELAPAARAGALQTYLQVESARVLGLLPERLDTTAPLSSFGFDSLMAVQLKNRIEADIGAIVPMVQFLRGQSVAQLVSPVLEAAEALEGAPAVATGASETWEEGSL
jgi:acyl transferase domain-containing protein